MQHFTIRDSKRLMKTHVSVSDHSKINTKVLKQDHRGYKPHCEIIPPQGQRQVRNRFKSFLAGKDLPKRRPAGGSPMGGSPFGGSPVGGSPMACSPLAEMPSGMSPGRGVFSMSGAKGGNGKAHKGQAVPDPGAESLASAVEEAIAECVRRGRLPDVEYPTPRVAVPTAKQSKALPITTRCVS